MINPFLKEIKSFDEDFLSRPGSPYSTHHDFPFGMGSRFCVGESFAWCELKIILALFILNFDFEIDPKTCVGKDPLISIRPRPDFKIKIS